MSHPALPMREFNIILSVMINNKLYLKQYTYPFADRVNGVLYDITQRYNNNNPVKGIGSDYGAWRTNQDLHQKNIKEIDSLMIWIKNLIPAFGAEIAGGVPLNHQPTYPKTGGIGGFDLYDYTIESCWGIIYNKGMSVVKHNHFPYTFSFCYYANTPANSSPLIIEGKRMRMKEGELIIFLSHYNHWVPTSKVDGRCVIAGNIKHGGTSKVSL